MPTKITSADSKHNRWKTSCLLCRLSGKALGKMPQFMTQWRVLENRVSKSLTCSIHKETRVEILELLKDLREKQDAVTSKMLSLTSAPRSIVKEEAAPLPNY